ncbi:MAG: NAD-dependent epimerase/dehydratase family protein [Planctomycetes bacterium]|nr:NAD-dependent epimerase/dehydratase family protein [Planctomycetota bacterium]
MTTSRRSFLQATAAATAATAGLASMSMAAPRPQATRRDEAREKLDLLILGGTGFLGPHVVEAALARGHRMTLFNRGRTNTHLFPEQEKLRGDRDPRKGDGLTALEGRDWDAVVDTSGYFPRMVSASAGMLAKRVRQYVFVSSISAYADTSKPGIDETAPAATMDDETLEEFGDQFQHYGALKVLCEQAAERAMPGRTTNVRPGLIVGPRDNVPRFTYWPVRIEKGGEVLAPGDPGDPVQYIDVRDLADFIVSTIEDRTVGVFNATGPTTPTNIAEMLYGCKAVAGPTATFTWCDADFLTEQGVQGWSHVPVWVPPRGESGGMHRISVAKAVAAGLTSRSLADTVRATLDWYHAWPADTPFRWRGGVSAEREAEVLAAWHAAHG